MNSITKEFLESKIKDVQYHVVEGTTVTVCTITVENGFTAVGHSACVSKENFDQHLGETYAYENALEKLWEVYGFWLRQKLFEEANSNVETTFVERMQKEVSDLSDKLAKLSTFIEKCDSDGSECPLSEEDVRLLKDQKTHMANYLEVLTTRLNRYL